MYEIQKQSKVTMYWWNEAYETLQCIFDVFLSVSPSSRGLCPFTPPSSASASSWRLSDLLDRLILFLHKGGRKKIAYNSAQKIVMNRDVHKVSKHFPSGCCLGVSRYIWLIGSLAPNIRSFLIPDIRQIKSNFYCGSSILFKPFHIQCRK